MENKIIFEMSDNRDYRVVCTWGSNTFIKNAWWITIEKKSFYKKWLFFGERKHRWKEIKSDFSARDFENREQLEECAKKFYVKKVVKPMERMKKAICI